MAKWKGRSPPIPKAPSKSAVLGRLPVAVKRPCATSNIHGLESCPQASNGRRRNPHSIERFLAADALRQHQSGRSRRTLHRANSSHATANRHNEEDACQPSSARQSRRARPLTLAHGPQAGRHHFGPGHLCTQCRPTPAPQRRPLPHVLGGRAGQQQGPRTDKPLPPRARPTHGQRHRRSPPRRGHVR